MYMIHKHLYEPQKHSECKHKALLQKIVELLLFRAEQGCHTTFLKVKSHIGIAGNEAADKLAGEATDSSKCDQAVSAGSKGLKDMFWPTKTVQAARQDSPAVTWQVGNLSHDVKKTVAPVCQTGLTNNTIYTRAWEELEQYIMKEPSNVFFHSTSVTFQQKKNTLKARYGALWNKKLAYRFKSAYIEGGSVARNAKSPLCKEPDSTGHILGGCTHQEVKKVYIARHDEAMRLIMKEIQKGGMGSYYCTADVGTADVMTELGADSKRLPDWLITTETMHKHDFLPEDKPKLRPDCMIVEVPHQGPGPKRNRDGSQRVSAQLGGKPIRVWIVELGYTSDTRYLDKLAEKRQQHEKL